MFSVSMFTPSSFFRASIEALVLVRYFYPDDGSSMRHGTLFSLQIPLLPVSFERGSLSASTSMTLARLEVVEPKKHRSDG